MLPLKKSINSVLITGGAGFIGSTLIRRLLNSTSLKIYNLDKLSYCSDLTSINELISTKGCSYKDRYQLLKVDLANKKATFNAVKISNPDLVIHLAAESHVDRSIETPSKFIESNIQGTFNILEAAKEHWINLDNDRKNVFRFNHISTDEVYGSIDSPNRFSEITPYSPRSPYSASKAASDHLVNAWHHTYNLPIVITNCSNNFGPWQFPEKLIPVVINSALSGRKIPLYGNGENIRDWLFVEDHIDAILLAILKGEIGESYCIGGFGEKKNKDVVTSICTILDKILPKVNSYSSLIKFVKDRPGHDQRYSINSSKIRNDLGWKPKYTFEEALEITVRWYINNQYWSNSREN